MMRWLRRTSRVTNFELLLLMAFGFVLGRAWFVSWIVFVAGIVMVPYAIHRWRVFCGLE